MTDRQGKLLNSGLKLFAVKGYHATSTNEVAKHAGVSEGLIFRHFINKEGLLKAILLEGEQKVLKLYQQVIDQPTAKKVIKSFLELPFNVAKTEYTFWKLLFTLKWELNTDSLEKAKPLRNSLIVAFTELSYESPIMEADFLMHYFDGLISAILKGETEVTQKLRRYLITRYNV